ncbi:MAG TPA: serine/threonine-protein kinase [Labilithrix sp.]|nr:serine/threonine-protein kinase [Labilithrix sp.]
MALEPAKLSDFKLGAKLGTGTTAMVYGAVHIATGRPVAIKVMAEAGPNHERRERFAREALLLADVRSRHVCKILGFGFDRGQPFLVLDRLYGETLDDKLRRDGAIPPGIALRWIEQLIIGVRDCHAAKIIHRDIKPSNVFLRGDGDGETVTLIDFGVARLREIAECDDGLTSVSHLIGSMGYMAPEQFANAKTVGFSADLYALGVVVFRTLTGRLPFVSRSLEVVVRMKREQPPPLLSSMPGMRASPLLDRFVQTAMAHDPRARFQTAREMLEQWGQVMADFQRGRSSPPPRADIGASDDSPTDRRTRGRRTPIPLPSQVASQVAERTVPGVDPLHDDDANVEDTVRFDASNTEVPSYDDLGAATIRSQNGDDLDDLPALGREESPFDVPTQPHVDLKMLVDRELELHRARLREGD